MSTLQDMFRAEFCNDLWKCPPREADIDCLCSLIEDGVLACETCYMEQAVQIPMSCMYTQLWAAHWRWHAHQKDLARQTSYAMIKLSERYPEIMTGNLCLIQEPWYFGYRGDLGIVFPPFNEGNHALVVVELGITQIIKVVEGLTRVRPLQEIWHFPGDDSYIIWRKGPKWH